MSKKKTLTDKYGEPVVVNGRTFASPAPTKKPLSKKKSTDTGLFCGVIPDDLAKVKKLLKRVNDAFKPMPKREFVWVGVWHLEADDPVVFVSKTLHGLDLQIYEAIKDGFDEVFGDDTVPKNKSKAIGEYFQLCSDRGIAEWLLTTKEEVK